MILSFLRPDPRRAVVERLTDAVLERALTPDFYLAGVPDTFEGRFEVLALHAILLVRRLKDAPAPGPDMAQDLTDRFFTLLDRSLRESGVGDTRVPKRVRGLGESYFGRVAVYEPALATGDHPQLAAALARNVFGVDSHPAADMLAQDAIAVAAVLADTPLEQLARGEVVWPAPGLSGGGAS